MDRSSVIFIFLNLLTISTLIVLLVFGAYVNVNNFIVIPAYFSRQVAKSLSNNVYRAIPLDSASWNVGCTVIGTAIGILAAITFEHYDNRLTRREIASDNGVNVVFLRPLTWRRGYQQFFREHFRIRRMLLFILVMIAALSSTAAVAMLSVRTVTLYLIKHNASYPLSFVAPGSNCTFFRTEINGSVSTFTSSMADEFLPHLQVSQLGGFLYKISYNAGLNLDTSSSQTSIPEQNTLGEVTYKTFQTGGIGVNLTSYISYSGTSKGYSPPPTYQQFYDLFAVATGTNVTVQCRNVTSQYEILSQYVRSEDSDTAIAIDLQVSKSGAQEFNFVKLMSSVDDTAIGSVIPSVYDSTTEPLHTLIIPYSAFSKALVLECSYSGYDWIVNFVLGTPGSAIQTIYPKLWPNSPGVEIGTSFQWTLMEMAHQFLSADSRGGVMTQALIDAKANISSYLTPSTYNNDEASTMIAIANLTTTIETILGQLSEGYISLLRQRFEASNVECICNMESGFLGDVEVQLTINRLGGSSYGWFIMPVLLLLGSLLGLTDAFINKSKKLAKFDAQDSVQLLATALNEENFNTKSTKVKYDGDTITVEHDEEISDETIQSGIVKADPTDSMIEVVRQLSFI